jgi:glycosyltransferase involved in cell wall biosynthesis|tara:strand:+ start:1463 stop:2587 length:1125 start_codon:yes stop_codon:yes gene_type:complete
MLLKILIVANTSWYLYNFRLGLISALLDRQYEVSVLAPKDGFSDKLKRAGCEYIHLEMNNMGLNPISDLWLQKKLSDQYREINPDLILHYTVKPVLYGSMMAGNLGIPFVNNITGLGTVFIKRNWVTWLVKRLYRISQKNADYVFFQNTDDRELFSKEKLIPENVPMQIIPGTGINIDHFNIRSYPENTPVKFLLIARMLWDKGVGEFVEAARQIKSEFSNVHFQLLGFLDVENRTAISSKQVKRWDKEGVVEYMGETDDVREHIANSSCVVLPSYREGLPRTLLEAASMGRPIIATDVTGCREVVKNGVNGYLCRVRNATDLTIKIKNFLRLSVDERRSMGLEGRAIVEEEFNEKILIEKIVSQIEKLLSVHA